jgi:PAS domain S-box-containing protein
MERNKTISGTFQRYSLFITVVSLVLFTIFWILLEFIYFNKEARKQKQAYINEQKANIKNIVNQSIANINISTYSMEKNLRNELREKIDFAHAMSVNIYENNKRKYSNKEILKIVKDALRPVRFFNGRGYYFIVSLDGVEQLYPIKPEYEGLNLLNLQDSKGNYVIKDELKIVTKAGDGFVEDFWPLPGDTSGIPYRKISYVKLVKPLNIYIGCGEYFDDVIKDIQQKVIDRIARIKYGKNGYLYINTYDGHALVIQSDKYKSGDYIWEMTDSEGGKVIQEQRKLIDSPEKSGFYEHSWEEPGRKGKIHKLSYVKSIPEWNWIIGAFAELDGIDTQIEAQRKDLIMNMVFRILGILMFMGIMIIIVFFAYKGITGKLKKSFTDFIHSLSYSLATDAKIDPEKFEFSEFKFVSIRINKLLNQTQEARNKLIESEERFRTIYENAPVMIHAFNSNNKCILWNQECIRTLGYTFDDINQLTSPLKYFFSTEEDYQRAKASVLQSDGVFREFVLRRKDGVDLNQFWANYLVANNVIISVGYDVTELKQTEFKLRENEVILKDMIVAKDKFFSIISHDLKNPIHGILGLSEVLLTDYEQHTDASRKEYLKMIYTSSGNIYKLLDNLLGWAKSQGGKIVVKPLWVNVYNVVSECFSVLCEMSNQKNITLFNEVNPDLKLFVDYEMLTTVIRNLVSNSIKFTPKGGLVKVTSFELKNKIQLKVVDTGVGMSDEKLGKLFKVGEKVETKGTEGENGTGIGLLLCKEFVEKNGGIISVSSSSGFGSEFTLEFAHS